MSQNKPRHAGDAVYDMTDEYGDWKDSWDSSAVRQQVKGKAGAYKSDSEYATKFNSLKQADNSKVDDAHGWRELVYNKDDKNAGSYADQVAKWQAAGFDVRARDMSDEFNDGNIAVRRATLDYRNSYQDHYDNVKKPKRNEMNLAAREAMGDAYKSDISKYDYKAYGNKKFDHQDIKHLRAAGYSDDDIAKYSSGLGREFLSESVRHNYGKFAGEHATAAFAEGGKISDHDVGKGFNMADVKYLRNAGFSDQEIAKHAHGLITKEGKGHGNAMSKFMDSQGFLDYYRPGHQQGGGGSGTGTGTETGTGTGGGSTTGGSSDITNNPQIGSGNTNTGGAGGTATSSQDFKDMYASQISESFNATGGTLTNSGDLTAGGDITLDNSVTNQNTMNTFGGDVRNFTYNAPGGGGSSGGGGGGGGASYPSMNSYKDPALNATPVSAATMAGFYAPSDSPAAAAKFNALHSELNRGKQEKYTNVGSDVAKKYIDAASKSKTINTKALNANLAAQPMVNFAQSDLITAQTFGDIWKFKPKDFYMPDPFTKPEQPDFEDMYSNIADDIKG